MRAVIQRVSQASVSIEQQEHAAIGRGLLIFLGVGPSDDATDITWLAEKIAKLRIFADAAGKMNESVVDQAGAVLVVSQFTLFANTKKGTRPTFTAAAEPVMAKRLYLAFVEKMQTLVAEVKTGVFAADMDVALHNDGPITISIDSRDR